MVRLVLRQCLMVALLASAAIAQERGDHFFKPDSARDMFAPGQGPKVYGEEEKRQDDEETRAAAQAAQTPMPQPTPYGSRGWNANPPRRVVGPGNRF